MSTRQKVVKKYRMSKSSAQGELKYWLSKSTEERVSAVEILRRQYYGSSEPRIKKVVRVIKRKKSDV